MYIYNRRSSDPNAPRVQLDYRFEPSQVGECPNRPAASLLPGITCQDHPDVPPPSMVLACFDPFKTDLKEHHYRQLDALIARISESFENGTAFNRIHIVGHGAKWPPGSKDERIAISKSRAARVQNELVKRLMAAGIDLRQIEITKTGVGCMQPRVPTNSKANRRLNLRVVVELRRRSVTPPGPKPPGPGPGPGPKPPGPGPSPPAPLPKAPRIRGCSNSALVRQHWADAVRAGRRAVERLRLLFALSEADRRREWKAGPEQIWFGSFHPRRARRVQRRMENILEVLTSRSKLRLIRCTRKIKSCGRARPGIPTIVLGRCWLDDLGPVERTETVVHEAAHIAGLTVLFENRKDEAPCAQRLALVNPRQATRNAENYGWYATCFLHPTNVNCRRIVPVASAASCK